MKTQRLVLALILACVLLSAYCAAAIAAPGDVDRLFGRDGTVELPTDMSVYKTARGLAAGPGGQLYVLRSRSICGLPCPTVERIRPDGSVDFDFGVGGVVALGSGESGTVGGSLAVAPDGKILVATFNRVGHLTRLNPDGTVDSAFGEAGSLTFGRTGPITNDQFRVFGAQVSVGADGKPILAVDQGTPSGHTVLEVSRYMDNGASDPRFGHGRPVDTALERSWGGIALFGDGALAVAGTPCCTEPAPVSVARLLSDGASDATFGRSGLAEVDPGRNVHVVAVLARPDGGVDVVATRELAGAGSFILRLRPDGTLEQGFGRGGILSLSPYLSDASAALADDRGRITVIGRARTGQRAAIRPDAPAVVRFLPNGRVDRTFDGGVPVQLLPLRHAAAVAAVLGSNDEIAILTQTGICVRSCTPFRAQLTQYIGGSSFARCLGRRATIVGTRRGETLKGTGHRDVIAGLAGNDRIEGRGGNDLICGGPGHDRIDGGPGRNRIAQ